MNLLYLVSEAHRKHVREYRSRLKREAEKQESSQLDARKTSVTDEELWARLDQLESIENERKEMLKVGFVFVSVIEKYLFYLRCSLAGLMCESLRPRSVCF